MVLPTSGILSISGIANEYNFTKQQKAFSDFYRTKSTGTYSISGGSAGCGPTGSPQFPEAPQQIRMSNF